MGMEPENGRVLLLEVPQAADEGTPLVELQQSQELVLGEVNDAFVRGMTGNPTAVLEPLQMWWKPGA